MTLPDLMLACDERELILDWTPTVFPNLNEFLGATPEDIEEAADGIDL